VLRVCRQRSGSSCLNCDLSYVVREEIKLLNEVVFEHAKALIGAQWEGALENKNPRSWPVGPATQRVVLQDLLGDPHVYFQRQLKCFSPRSTGVLSNDADVPT
jgi:hypothetical protein